MRLIVFLILFNLPAIFYCSGQTFSPLPPGFNSSVRTLFFDTTSNLLYAGGNFSKYSNGAPLNHIARWNGTLWDSMGNGLNANVYSIVNFNGNIYAGGNFAGSGSMISRGLAKWDGGSWQPFGGINSQSGIAVWHLNVINNELYVFGTFDSIGNLPANGMAKFDGQNWFIYPNLDPFGIYNTVALFNNELYVGGNFNGGSGLKDLVKFDGVNWVNVGGGFSGGNTIVKDLKIYQNKLYVTGYFDLASGDPGNNIAIWDGSSWSQAGSGLMPSTVMELHEFQDELYAAGQITDAGGIPVTYVAKWDGINWYSIGSIFNNYLETFASDGPDLYLGGGFVTVDNDSMFRIAKYHNPIGVEELNHVMLTIGPNPSSDAISIDYPNWKKSVILLITDLSGRTICAYNDIYLNNFKLNISGIPEGMYILQLKSSNLNYRKKVIISSEIKN